MKQKSGIGPIELMSDAEWPVVIPSYHEVIGKTILVCRSEGELP